MEEVKQSVGEILAKQTETEKKVHNFREAINTDYKLLDSALGDIDKQKKELHRLEKSLTKLKDKGVVKKEEVDAIYKQVEPVRASIKKIGSNYAPETGSLFVRLFLGKVNVKAYREGERFRMKQEYETFKGKTNPQFMAFVVLLFMFPHSPFLVTIWQIWLLYYYITLALRENILKVNGSSIKPWWILHHYLSIAGSLTMLLWPMGIVQILINKYQQGQLYKLVAMGKATLMDVPGEAEGWIKDTAWTPSAMFLLPFLVFVQTFELYLSYQFFRDLFYSYKANEELEWQVAVIGLVFFILGTGNLATTGSTYYQKFKFRNSKKEKRGRGHLCWTNGAALQRLPTNQRRAGGSLTANAHSSTDVGGIIPTSVITITISIYCQKKFARRIWELIKSRQRRVWYDDKCHCPI